MWEQRNISYEALMAEFQQTLDKKAFGEIVSRYTQPGLTVARQLLYDNHLAEDAVQETFMRLIRHRGQYKASQSFSGWFYAILRNTCFDMLRKKKRGEKVIQEIALESEITIYGPSEPVETGLKLLNCLPRGEQDVLQLRILEEMSFRDIGISLGISEEAAKKRGQRGLQRLRKIIRESEVEDLPTKEIA
ncbi:MAG: sigma-70 family RNA polymerase sigma factor [Planctomycetes bacterium]|nr:sigma-70 family RNA polymerase sigma factor [Planctomycetota bacterium]